MKYQVRHRATGFEAVQAGDGDRFYLAAELGTLPTDERFHVARKDGMLPPSLAEALSSVPGPSSLVLVLSVPFSRHGIATMLAGMRPGRRTSVMEASIASSRFSAGVRGRPSAGRGVQDGDYEKDGSVVPSDGPRRDIARPAQMRSCQGGRATHFAGNACGQPLKSPHEETYRADSK